MRVCNRLLWNRGRGKSMDGYLEQKAPLLKQTVKGRELPHETVN